MFVGHYSAAFAVKAVQPKTPLWTLFKANDKARYALGLPHEFDILDPRWP